MAEQMSVELKNFNEMEQRVLDQVMEVSKAILETFKFKMIYDSKVTPEQNQRTIKALQDFRTKHWDTSVSKKEAYKKYIRLYD